MGKKDDAAALQHVVIVGGGFAGLQCAGALAANPTTLKAASIQPDSGHFTE